MIFLMTKDSFLLQGFWQLKDNHEMIKINSLSEIKAPIYFVSRKESIKNLLEITYGKHLPHKNSQLCFSHNQFKIMQLILKNKNESNITSTLNISQQTLKIQKFNIMYKLKLRRMSDIVTLGITSYF